MRAIQDMMKHIFDVMLREGKKIFAFASDDNR